MAGLIQQQMAPEAAPPEEAAAAPVPAKEGAPPAEEEGEAAGDEEQQQYERVVLAGVKILYDEKTNPDILNMLKQSAQNPAQAIGQVSVTILQGLVSQAQQPIPEEILFNASLEIIGEVITLAESAEIFAADETVQAQGVQKFAEMAIEANLFTPEFIQQMMSEFDEGQTQQMVAEQDQLSKSGQPQAAPPQAAPQPTAGVA